MGLREDCKSTKIPCNVDAGVDERSDCKAGGACGDNTMSGLALGYVTLEERAKDLTR